MADNDGNRLYQNRDEADNNLRTDPEWERGVCSHLGYYGKIVTNLGGVSAVAQTDRFMTRSELEGRLKSQVTDKLLGALGMSKGLFGKHQSELIGRDDLTSLLIGKGFFNDKSDASETAEEMIKRGVGGYFQGGDMSDYFFQEFTNTMGQKKYRLVKRSHYDYGY
jgi:hypothetical protein